MPLFGAKQALDCTSTLLHTFQILMLIWLDVKLRAVENALSLTKLSLFTLKNAFLYDLHDLSRFSLWVWVCFLPSTDLWIQICFSAKHVTSSNHRFFLSFSKSRYAKPLMNKSCNLYLKRSNKAERNVNKITQDAFK